jgi:hypothetical protein
MTRLPRGVAAIIACAATNLAAGEGCGSADCMETATCADPASDGASPGDRVVQETRSVVETGGDDVEEGGTEVSADVEAVSDSGADGDAVDGPVQATADSPADAPAVSPADAPADVGPGDAAGSCNANSPNCADPQCQPNYMCTAAAPPGWFGPVALFDQGGGPPAPTPPACSGAYPNDAFDGNANPTSPGASCACTCGAALGACAGPTVTVYSDNQCVASNNCGTGAGATCSVVDGARCSSGGQSYVVAALPQPTGSGSCTVGTATTSLPAWQWTRTARACRANRAFAAGGCATNQVCADRPSSALSPTLCVWQNADLGGCNGAPGYPLMHKYYANVVDDRHCGMGSCNCGSPKGVSCALTRVTSYTQTDCSDPGSALLNPIVGHCNDVGINQVVGMIAGVSSAGSCDSSGSAAPTGAVTPDSASAVTVCCAQ